MTITISDTDRMTRDYGDILKSSRRASVFPILALAAVFLYLAYAWFAFDIPNLIEKAKLERGAILAVDTVAYKYHVNRYAKDGNVVVTIERQRDTTFDTPPDWVQVDGRASTVDLGDGYTVAISDGLAVYTDPKGQEYRVGFNKDEVTLDGYHATIVKGQNFYYPPGSSDQSSLISEQQMRDRGIMPEGASFTSVKFEVRPVLFKRLQVTRAQIEIHRYFLGWEYFFFPPKSPLSKMTNGEIWQLVQSGERIDPTLPNWQYVLRTFWDNPEWQHGLVFEALLETILMAVLGTMTAGLVALPLAFVAAANFNPFGATRMIVRRVFDFLRGIDNLIWSLIFIRAFGLGPLTGSLAIAFTDTGTLGKLFSEALENVDNKQIEGVRATGAGTIQRYRFGVIPQILPIFISQTLYYLESNTRSATVIGALGAGGIGLKLVQTLQTHQDWENVTYLIILTLMLVISMDIGSGWLRRKLIGDKG
jgi:phosphonate transport system permease protein